uniref:U3 small nucleolar ribonucleoprotein protein MPP10 n=1 Tax=Meloidogyne floridensis TaxID=298350 RepID=A0A915P308_9BILA
MSQNKNKKYLRPDDDVESGSSVNEESDEFEDEASENEITKAETSLNSSASDEELEEAEEGDGSSNCYEEDIESVEAVEARRRKLPKSVVDDQFFNLTEMEAFLDAQDKAEEEQRKNPERNLGDFDIAKEMDSIIQSYEEENLKPRNWVLQGEVVGEERKTDELLEHLVDVDYQVSAPPTINEETTQRLETIIRKRCKEKFFDDVVRKFRENEAALIPTVYRNQTEIEQNVRKSLAEVYEDKLSNAQKEDKQQEKITAELDPQTAEIQKDMNSLFLSLDALSHFQFRPQILRTEEAKIVNNMPSLRVEEVGPTATTEPDVNLLAPEEIVRRTKAIPKSKIERTETDKKRERRHKKKRQHVIASINAINGKNRDETNDGKPVKRRRFEKKLNFAADMDALFEKAGKMGKKIRTKGIERAKMVDI